MINQGFFRSLAGGIGLTGIAILLNSPSFSQTYPPMALFQPIATYSYPYRNEKTNLADSLANNPNYQNLADELKVAGLTITLEQKQYTTLLAPSDAAFEALPDDVFDKFSQPENRKKVLQYHLIPGKVTEADIKKGEIKTLAGKTIAISSKTGTVKLNDANPTFPPTFVSNGVIIEIDRVLLPPDF